MKVELHGAAVPQDVLADGIEWADEPAPPAPPRVFPRLQLLRYLQKCTARLLRSERKILRRKHLAAAEEKRQSEIQEAKEYIGIQ